MAGRVYWSFVLSLFYYYYFFLASLASLLLHALFPFPSLFLRFFFFFSFSFRCYRICLRLRATQYGHIYLPSTQFSLWE